MDVMLTIFGVLSTVGGIMVAMIGYFLSSAMRDLREVEKQTIKNSTSIEVQKERFDGFENKINEMRQDIKELVHELKKKL